MKIKYLAFFMSMATTLLLGSSIQILAEEASTIITYTPEESEKVVPLTISEDEDESSALGSVFSGENALVVATVASGIATVGGITCFVRIKGNA